MAGLWAGWLAGERDQNQDQGLAQEFSGPNTSSGLGRESLMPLLLLLEGEASARAPNPGVLLSSSGR